MGGPLRGQGSDRERSNRWPALCHLNCGEFRGTFLPVLWLIPAYGTRWTFYLLALALLGVVSIGKICAKRIRWLPLLALLCVLLVALFTHRFVHSQRLG